MQRFWIFSTRLVLVGAILFGLSSLPSLLFMVWIMAKFNGLIASDNFFTSLAISSAIGAAAGLVMSLPATIWDFLRNGVGDRKAHSTKSRLLPNLCWCGVYTLPFHLLNSVLFGAFYNLFITRLMTTPTPPSTPWTVTLYFLGLAPYFVNLLALWWAAARTITQTDVLTPRVLKQKLKRSASLSTS